MKHSGLKFKEKKILLDRPGTARQIQKFSPSKKVPALIEGDLSIWDSLAICERIAELAPAAQLWPNDEKDRALARSMVAEMHSSFQSMRGQLSMDIVLRMKIKHLTSGTIADIQRILEIWQVALRRSGGPYLFGHFTIADAFFAPVVMRFQSYGINVKNSACQKYIKTILRDKFVREWIRDAKKEKTFDVEFR